jgi:hypothetical protein
MKPRIESVEVLNFRLKVPLAELEQLADTAAGKQLGLTLEYDGNELVLGCGHSDSALRFRPIGAEAMLSEIAIARDEGGAFCQGVLLALATRFRGDLHLKVVWNEGERNTHGNWAEVKVARGVAEAGAPAYAPAGAASGPTGEQIEPLEQDPEPPLTEQERELSELLTKARAYWDEYQRLKAGK